MKKIALIYIFFIASSQLFAQTNVSGGIFSNTTWTLSNSPYIVTGPVVVFPNVTLTIEPGVVVKIEEKSNNTSEQLYIEIRGRLVAKGTSNLPISFIPNTPPSLGIDQIWQGINVKTALGGSIDMDYFVFNNSYYGISYDNILLDTLRFNECKFNYNNYTLSINTNFVLNKCEFYNNGTTNSLMYLYGSVVANDCIYKNNFACMSMVANGVNVSNSTFENNQSCFIQISGSFKNCSFKNNNIVFQENGLLDIDSSSFINNNIGINEMNGGRVTNSSFQNNTLALSVGENSMIEKNNISNNTVGLALVGKFTNGMVLPFVRDNKICDNSLYNLENKSDFNLGLENNCFCLNDSLTIEQKIFDGYDDITRGLINFATYDSLCLTIKQRFIKINLSTGVFEEKREVNVYPNPFIDKINLMSDEKEIDWNVIDVTGRTIFTFTSNSNNNEIDLSSLVKGIYILKSTEYRPVKIIKN